MSDHDECLKCGGPCANTQEVCVRCVAEEEAEQGIITPEQREVVEAVIGGAKIAYETIEEDWDMWCVSIPREPDFTPVTKPCPECKGTGEIFVWVQTEKTKCPTHKIGYLDDRECPACHGTGVMP